MEYSNIMTDAVNIFNDRNPKYGDMKVGMEKVATIATIITGIHLTPHDVALVLHAVKLSRLNNDRANPDHYVDGVNYLAFAGELIAFDAGFRRSGQCEWRCGRGGPGWRRHRSDRR